MVAKSPQSVQRCRRICETWLGISLSLLLLEDKNDYSSHKFLFLSLLLAEMYATFVIRHNLKCIFITNRSKDITLPTNIFLPQLSLSMQLKPFRPLLRVKSVSAACPSNLIIFYPAGRQGELQWNLPIPEPRGTRLFDLLQAGSVYYSHYHVVCPKTVPKPLTKPVTHRMIASVSSFNFLYVFVFVNSSSSCLNFLPRLPVTTILTFFFPSTTFLEGSSYTRCDQSS